MVGETKPDHPLPPRRAPFPRRQLLMQVLVAGVILVSGIGIGAGGTILALKDRIVWDIPSPPDGPGRPSGRGPRPDGGGIVEMLRTKYGLSDEQTQQVRDVFDRRAKAARERWKQLVDTEDAERAKLVEDMKPILTAEQFEKWHADYQKMIEDIGNRPFRGPRGDRRGPPRGDRGPGRSMDPDGRHRDGPPRPPPDAGGRHRDRPPERPPDGNQPS